MAPESGEGGSQAGGGARPTVVEVRRCPDNPDLARLADRVAEALRREPGLQTRVVDGGPGEFAVLVDGRQVAGKAEGGPTPSVEGVLDRVGQAAHRLTDPLGRLAGSAPAKRAFSLAQEFRAFAFKGNLIDLAVGIILGAAFSKLVDSLVKNVVMPLLSVLLPTGQSYQEWHWVIAGVEVPYGLFLGELVTFLVVSLTLFLFAVKFLRWVARVREEVPPLTKEQELLTEIRDLLKQKQDAPPVDK